MCCWFNSNNHPLLSSEANAGFASLIPESGRSPGEGNGNPLQYSCLGNPMGRGAWRATVHGGHKELDTTEQARTLISFFHQAHIPCVLIPESKADFPPNRHKIPTRLPGHHRRPQPLTSNSVLVPSPTSPPQEDRAICWFSSLTYPKHLALCLAQCTGTQKALH